jgi:hypothetical protein
LKGRRFQPSGKINSCFIAAEGSPSLQSDYFRSLCSQPPALPPDSDRLELSASEPLLFMPSLYLKSWNQKEHRNLKPGYL